MTCPLDGVAVHFEKSGIIAEPLSIDANHKYDSNDWADVTFTRKAIDHIEVFMMDKEPITIRANDNIVFRGWASTGDVTIGTNTGHVSLRDPLEILDAGSIEWSRRKTTLREVVTYLFSQREDPHNVLGSLKFTTDPNVVGYKFYEQGDPTNPLGDETLYADWLVDTLNLGGVFSGPAQFDYNGESPRECLAEACKAFGVQMFAQEDGTFTVGMPDYEATLFQASVRDTPWKVTNYSIPSFEQPLGPVYVRGVESMGLDGDLGNAMDPQRFINRVDHAVPWASARMKGYVGEPMAIEYAKSGDPEVLESVARSILIQRYHNAMRGALTINPLAKMGGEVHPGVEALAAIQVGDVVETVDTAHCDLPEAQFRVEAVTHSMDASSGWRMNLQVSAMIANKIYSKSWYNNPVEDNMDDMSTTELLIEIAGAGGAVPGSSKYWPGFGVLDPITMYEAIKALTEGTTQSADDLADDLGGVVDTVGTFLPNDSDSEEQVDKEEDDRPTGNIQ